MGYSHEVGMSPAMERLSLWLFAGLVGAGLVACFEPHAPPSRRATLAIVPLVSDPAALLNNADLLRIRVERVIPGGVDLVADTTVAIDPETGEASADITVALLASPQEFRIRLDAIRSSDGMVLFSGSETILVSAGADTPRVEIPVSYSGPPAGRLNIAPDDTVVSQGAAFRFRATVFDTAGNVIDVPVTYDLDNPADSAVIALNRATGDVSVKQDIGGAVLVVATTKDSVPALDTAFVAGFRGRWLVDPGRAQERRDGSDAFPFATIAQAVGVARPGDTIAIAVATYPEPLSTTKALVFLGDSGAAGMPTISPSTGPAGDIAASGRVVLRRLNVSGTQDGLNVKADTVDIGSVGAQSVIGPAVRIPLASRVILSGLRISDGQSAGIIVDTADVVTISNSVVQNYPATGLGIGVMADSVWLVDDTVVAVGTGVVRFSPMGVAPAPWFGVWGGQFRDTDYEAIVSFGDGVVELVGVEVTGSFRFAVGEIFGYGVSLYDADSVRVDSSNVHDNFAGGIIAGRSRAFVARDNTVGGSHFTTTDLDGLTERTAMHLEDIGTAVVSRNTFADNVGAGLRVLYFGVDGAATVEQNTFRGRYWGVAARGPDSLTGHLEIRDNSFTGNLLDSLFTRQIGLGPLRTMVVENNVIDSAFGQAIGAWPGDTIIVRNNTITNVAGSDGIHSERGGLALFEGNTITCTDDNQAVIGISYHDGGGTIANNAVTACTFGGFSDNSFSTLPYDLVIRGNTFSRGSAVNPPLFGYQVQYGLYRAEIVGNTVSGFVSDGFGGISLVGTGMPMLHARIDSNTVQSGNGVAVRVFNVDTLLVRDNTVTGMGTLADGSGAGILLDDVLDTAAVVRNSVTANSGSGIFVRGTARGVVIDTNLITDNMGSGIVLDIPTTAGVDSVIVRRNSVRRNSFYGVFAAQMGGSFRENNFENNVFGLFNSAAPLIDARDSWWNDPLGPACVGACDPGSTGDNVSTSVIFDPFATAPVSGTPMGAAPATAQARDPRVSPGWASPRRGAQLLTRPARGEELSVDRGPGVSAGAGLRSGLAVPASPARLMREALEIRRRAWRR